MRKALAVAEDLAREAGALLWSWQDRLQAAEVASKSARRDLVTAADLASEELLVRRLQQAFPGDGILAEEGGDRHQERERVWYVDPLDGTVNFVQGLPLYSVSVALVVAGRPEVAVVHAPALASTWTALRGGGAFRDGRPLRVSATAELADAVLATGFPYRRHLLLDNNLENFQRFFLRVRGLRRLGSAALDLAWTAEGRLDGFWELHLQPFDVAAGGLLVSEAGGLVDTIVPGGDWLHGRNILAAPPPLAEAMRAVLRAGRGDDYPPLGERPEAAAES